MARPFKTNRHDRKPIKQALSREIPADSGQFQPIDLTNCTVRFLMADPTTGASIVQATATVVDAPNGVVQYDWSAGGTGQSGVFQAQWEITYSGNPSPETVPDGGYVSVVIQDDLG